MLTASRLRELLSYDPATGVFTARVGLPRRPVGSVAGTRGKDGYWRISIAGRKHYAHRLAWMYVNGSWPASQVDHKDGNPGNNWIDNLREATNLQNGQNRKPSKNNTSGFRGVTFVKKCGSWQASIGAGAKIKYLGSFSTPELAHAAYLDAKAKLHTFQPALRN